MVAKEDLVFRQVVTLRDGTRVLLRPLLHNDLQALSDLFSEAPYEDRRCMRDDVNDPEVISTWVNQIDYEKVFPLVAVMAERIVSVASLHFNRSAARHRCELRIYIATDFRRRGLGNKIVHALVEYARKLDLHMIEVQVVSDNVEMIKALQKAGFQAVCTLEDYFIQADGMLRDVVFLILRLRADQVEF
jgi:acetyltransferase